MFNLNVYSYFKGWMATLFLFLVLCVPVGAFSKIFNLELRLSPANQSLSRSVQKNVTIKMYKSGASTPLWAETHTGVVINNGVVKVSVGSVDPISNPIRPEFFNDEIQFSVSIDGEEAFWVFNAGSVYSLKSAVAERALSIDWNRIENRPRDLSFFSKITSANMEDGSVTLGKISRTGATTGQVLKWDGTSWAPGFDDGGTSYLAGNGLRLSGATFRLAAGSVSTNAVIDSAITTDKLANASVTGAKIADGTITSADISVTAEIPFSKLKIIKSDIVGLGIPSEDTVTTNATKLHQRSISAAAPSSGQVLKWDGSSWAPGFDDGGTSYFAGNGLRLTGSTFRLGAGSVSTNAVIDSAITEDKLAASSVTSAKIVNGTITNVDINDSAAISFSKLSILKSDIVGLGIPSEDTITTNATKLQQRSVSAVVPTSGQVLKWDGTSWAPASDDGGTSYLAGSGLRLTGATFRLAAGSVSTNAVIDSAITSVKILDGTVTSADISATAAIPFSKLRILKSDIVGLGIPSANTAATTTNATKLQQRPIASIMPSTGQVLKWDGSTWSPADDGGGTSYLAGNGLSLSGSVFRLAAGSVSTNAVIDSAITSVKILDDTITSADISTTAAIPFSKLRILKSDIVGLGIPSANTVATTNATKLQQRLVSAATPTSGQVLKWDGSTWAPADDGGGTSYLAGNGLSLSGSVFRLAAGSVSTNAVIDSAITSTKIADGTITSADISTTASIPFSKLRILKSDIVGLGIPSANTVATLNASLLQHRKIASEAPSAGQVLKWDGSAWAPADDGGGTSYLAGNGLSLSGSVFRLAAGSVSTNAVIDSAITSAKIADGTITSADISATAAIPFSKLSLSKSDLSLGNVDNTADASKPVSTAQQTALDLKLNIASANNYVSTSRTVNGHDLSSNVTVTKSDLSLENVDNTADINKPVSILQQAALALKVNVASANAFQDDLNSKLSIADASNFVTKSLTINNHVLDGNVTIDKSDLSLGNVDNTSDINKPVSTAQQTALDLKLNVASGNGYVLKTGTSNYDTAYTDRLKWDGGVSGLNVETARASLGLGSLAPLSTITTVQITDGTISSDDLADLAVTSSKIALNSIASFNIQNGAITTDKIAYNSITGDHFALGSIGVDSFKNNILTNDKLAEGVFTKIIGLGTLTTPLLGDSANFGTVSANSFIGNWNGTAIPISKGGTGTTASFTPGSIAFAGRDGVYSQNNSDLFWDDTNKYLGIGTSVPDTSLTVFGVTHFRNGTSGLTSFILETTNPDFGNSVIYAPVTRAASPDFKFLDFRTAGTDTFVVNGAGQVTAGTWAGTAVAISNGGTGATDSVTARVNLGLGTLATKNQITSSDIVANAAIPFSKLAITSANIYSLGVPSLDYAHHSLIQTSGLYIETTKLQAAAGNLLNISHAVFGGQVAFVLESSSRAGNTTVDWSSGSKKSISLTGSAIVTFTPPAGASNLTLIVKQDPSTAGGNTITWDGQVKWSGGIAPELTSAAGSIDVITFIYDGEFYYGSASLDFK